MSEPSRKKIVQNDRRARTRRKDPKARLVEFPQARGRIVEMVELSLDPEFYCVSIRFKDNIDLTVVIDAALTFRAEYSEWKAGEQKILKQWPMIRSHDG